MTHTITNRLTGAVIWSGEAETMTAAIHAARASRANLSGADLSRADLLEADLSWADLLEADLSGAGLTGADLTGANLSGANLLWANLSGATLVPPMALLATWGEVSDDLCADLMNYDAANHPHGAEAFAAWVAGGACPYSRCRVARSANFTERKSCYRPDRPLQSALQLMDRLIAEKTRTS